jgi:hypothetical protein
MSRIPKLLVAVAAEARKQEDSNMLDEYRRVQEFSLRKFNARFEDFMFAVVQ